MGMMVAWMSRAASVMVFAPTFIPYDAQITILSPWEKPWETKLLAYFSAYLSQSSHVRKKLFGIPEVPDVSWMVKTSLHSTLLNMNSFVTGGWFSRIVDPDISGRLIRSSCVFTDAGSIRCFRNHA